MPVKQMAMTPLWISPSNAFQHSAIVSLIIYMEGQCLAVLSSWQILSLLSTISGFVPFFRLSAVSPLTVSSTGYATVLKSFQLRVFHIRATCHCPKGIFISQINALRASTEHKT